MVRNLNKTGRFELSLDDVQLKVGSEESMRNLKESLLEGMQELAAKTPGKAQRRGQGQEILIPESQFFMSYPRRLDADVQWMVRKGFGLAQPLTTRAVAGVTWTADTAFVHYSEADHLALPLLVRHLRKGTNHKPRSPEPRKTAHEQLRLDLLA